MIEKWLELIRPYSNRASANIWTLCMLRTTQISKLFSHMHWVWNCPPLPLVYTAMFGALLMLPNDWLLINEMLKDGKLSTYLFLKTNFRLEKYLTLLRPEYRKPICRLRVSAHRLLIEMGRYNNTPRTERICKTACVMKLKMKNILLFDVTNSQKKEKNYLN